MKYLTSHTPFLAHVLTASTLVCASTAMADVPTSDTKRVSQPASSTFQQIAVWGTPEPVALRTPTIELTPSPSGGALTVLLGQSGVEVNDVKDSLRATYVLNLRVPYTLNQLQKLKSISTDLRGSLHKSAGARVSVFSDVNGVTQNLDWSYGKAKEISQYTHSFKASKNTGSNSTYSATFLIIVERKTPQDYASFNLDSLDINLNVKP